MSLKQSVVCRGSCSSLLLSACHACVPLEPWQLSLRLFAMASDEGCRLSEEAICSLTSPEGHGARAVPWVRVPAVGTGAGRSGRAQGLCGSSARRRSCPRVGGRSCPEPSRCPLPPALWAAAWRSPRRRPGAAQAACLCRGQALRAAVRAARPRRGGGREAASGEPPARANGQRPAGPAAAPSCPPGLRRRQARQAPRRWGWRQRQAAAARARLLRLGRGCQPLPGSGAVAVPPWL